MATDLAITYVRLDPEFNSTGTKSNRTETHETSSFHISRTKHVHKGRGEREGGRRGGARGRGKGRRKEEGASLVSSSLSRVHLHTKNEAHVARVALVAFRAAY